MHSILIPAARADKLCKRLRRLASKCGVELAIAAGSTTLYRLDAKRRVDTTRAIECARVTVGDMPRSNGYAFLGKLVHTEAGNVISLASAAQGIETPEAWRTAKPTCDHCGTTRRRQETFIIQTPAGAIVRVGRNCLADFLAGDPADFIALSAFEDALREAGSDDWSEGGCGGYHEPTTAHYLACAVSSIEAVGFFKRGGYGPEQPTAEAAAFLAGSRPSDPKAAARWLAGQPTAAHAERGAAVLAWLAANDDRSDYMHNLRVAAASIIAQRKFYGLLASAPQAYNRAMGEIAERAARAAAPDAGHFGEVGKRLDFEATILRVKAYDSLYGAKRMIAMRTADGHECITFTTGHGCTSNDVGATFQVRATVKRHSAYKGRAQTELTRCAFERIGGAADDASAA
jgi:hypothetical protein